jgi:hypothetical protein
VDEDLMPDTDERSDRVEADELGTVNFDGTQMAALLESIPGAWARIDEGIADARSGRTIPLDEL